MTKIPLVEKIYRTDSFFIERTLPDVGSMYVTKDANAEPFTKLGETKVSYFFEKIPPSFFLIRKPNTFIEKGVLIGERKKGYFKIDKLFAPYNGFIREVGDGSHIFEQEKENFVLYSGTWGKVVDLVENKSVLIKGSATIIYASVSTAFEAEGELVVLPNPSELLEDPYFRHFTKGIAGKVIYSGYFIKLENLKKAIDLGVKGIIAGGFDKVSFDYAQKNGFLLASISGFGKIPTPDPIYDLFQSVSNRYIFIRGQRGEILIPSADKFNVKESENKNFLVELKNDMIVQVLERPYFGFLGTVKGQKDGKIEVALSSSVEVISVRSTNLIALAF